MSKTCLKMFILGFDVCKNRFYQLHDVGHLMNIHNMKYNNKEPIKGP